LVTKKQKVGFLSQREFKLARKTIRNVAFTIQVRNESKKQAGSLKSIKSTSATKANKIMSQLESTEDKKTKIVSEEMNKMKNLISYDRKTQ